MAYNLIQFQHGMSLPEFIQCFGTEAACVDALQRAGVGLDHPSSTPFARFRRIEQSGGTTNQ